MTDGATVCGFSQFDNGGYTVRRFETFNFARMDARLAADSELRARAGMPAVASCEQARQFISVLNAYELELPTIEHPSAPTVEGPEPVEKIHLGETVTSTTGQNPQGGIVELNSLGCSGSFITGRHILTAGHCVAGNGTINLSYRAPTLAGGTLQTESFTVTRNPAWNGNGNRSNDHAILTRDAGDLAWAVNGNRFRWYTGGTKTGIGLAIFGYGAFGNDGTGAISGVLRTGQSFADINLNSHTDGYFHATAHTAKACRGDSGGPAVRQLSGSGNDALPVIWGTFHGAVFSDNVCPADCDDMYWTKTTTDQSFIEGVLGFSCTRFSNSDGTYARCF